MIQAAVAILQNNRRLLVGQRKKNSRYGLKWEFPGGKLKPGESVAECVRREVREELSIEIDAIARTTLQVNSYDDGGVYEVTYCFVSHYAGTPVNNAFEEIRWATLDELRSLDVLEGNMIFIASLDESIFL
jgi:A/G-specific adenine glycosylase